jgi:hypothetical protein
MAGRCSLAPFHRRSHFFCEGSILAGPPVTAEERISRFVFDSGHFGGGHVRFRAFLPPKDRRDVSVTRTEGLDEETVWADGQRVADAHVRALLARGDLIPARVRAIAVEDFSLDVEADEPPLRHANIVGFPSIVQKQIQKILAGELADIARLAVKP